MRRSRLPVLLLLLLIPGFLQAGVARLHLPPDAAALAQVAQAGGPQSDQLTLPCSLTPWAIVGEMPRLESGALFQDEGRVGSWLPPLPRPRLATAAPVLRRPLSGNCALCRIGTVQLLL